MEIVYIILLFLAPGLLINAIYEYMTIPNKKSTSGTVYEQLFAIVANSIVVSIILFFMINIYYTYNNKELITSLDELVEKFNYYYYLCIYLMSLLAISILWMIIYHLALAPWLRCIRDLYCKKQYGVKPGKNDGKTVLTDILYENSKKRKRMFVEIFKDGNFITAGEVRDWNEHPDDPLEWQLERTYEINKIKDRDRDKNDKDKWLVYVEYEYFNFENGILVKFYDPAKAVEHWREI